MADYKIALIGSGNSSGGLVSMLNEFLSYHPGRAVEVTLFCSQSFITPYKNINPNIRIVLTDTLNENKWSSLFGLCYKRSFKKLIKNYEPNAVFFITGSSKFGLGNYRSYIVLNNQLYTNFRRVLKQQSLGVSITTFIYGLKFRLRSNYISYIFYSSEYSKEESQNILKSKKYAVVPFACNRIFYKDTIENDTRARQTKTVKLLNIGSIIPYKNQELVIDALKLIKERGYSFSITFIGRALSKKYLTTCQNKINKYGLSDQVSFIEWLEPNKVIEYIDKSDILINSSETDTCATSVEEGMARCIPVIASDTPFNREMVRDGGLYFSLGNASSLADVIAEYIDSEDLRNQLARRGYDLSRQWTLSDTAKRYYEIIIGELHEKC